MAATYEPVAETTLPFGRNAYLEVARRRLKDAEGVAEFLVLSRGYFDGDGKKRWTKFVTLPDDPDVREWVAAAVRTI